MEDLKRLSSVMTSEGECEEVSYEDFDIGDRIGGGGFAIVWKAGWRATGRQVAVKELFDPRMTKQAKQVFKEEAKVLERIQRSSTTEESTLCGKENIVRIFGASLRAPHLFLVLELCHTSLFNALNEEENAGLKDNQCSAEQQGLSLIEKVDVLKQTAEGLGFLHTISPGPSIIHRDVKPQNILLKLRRRADDMLAGDEEKASGEHRETGRYIVKLCDFGLSSASYLQDTGSGTPAYMAPELLSHSAQFSRKVDVYSFGIVLWQTFTESIPFHGLTSKQEIADYVIPGGRLDVETGDRTRGIPRLFKQLIQKCWAADPASRPECKKIASALTKIQQTVVREAHLERQRKQKYDAELTDCFDELEKTVTTKHQKRLCTSTTTTSSKQRESKQEKET